MRSSAVITEPSQVRLDRLNYAKRRRPRKGPREGLPGLAELVDRTRVERGSASWQLPLRPEEAAWSRGLVVGEVEDDEEAGGVEPMLGAAPPPPSGFPRAAAQSHPTCAIGTGVHLRPLPVVPMWRGADAQTGLASP